MLPLCVIYINGRISLEKRNTYELISRGDKNGVALLYERYGKRLYGYALNSWRLGEDEAWDLIYKTLYKVVESTPQYTFESEEKYGSFIFKVFINYLRTHHRDKKSKPDLVLYEESPPEAKEPIQEADSDQMALLKEELDKFEDWERVLLLMRSQDLPYPEIAKYVDKPAEQLKVYYQRLKATLTKRMNDKMAIMNMVKQDPDERA